MATSTGKKMFYNQLGMELPDAYEYASQVMVDNMMTNDVAEGIDAFFEKRQAVWTGQ